MGGGGERERNEAGWVTVEAGEEQGPVEEKVQNLLNVAWLEFNSFLSAAFVARDHQNSNRKP